MSAGGEARGAKGSWRGVLWREGPGWLSAGLLALAAAGAWLIAGPLRAEVMSVALVWASLVLAFQGGERRGRQLSADAPTEVGGRSGRAARLAGPLLFVLAAGAMLSLQTFQSLAFLMAGQACVAITAPPGQNPLRRFGPAMASFVSLALMGSRLLFAP